MPPPHAWCHRRYGRGTVEAQASGSKNCYQAPWSDHIPFLRLCVSMHRSSHLTATLPIHIIESIERDAVLGMVEPGSLEPLHLSLLDLQCFLVRMNSLRE